MEEILKDFTEEQKKQIKKCFYEMFEKEIRRLRLFGETGAIGNLNMVSLSYKDKEITRTYRL